MNFDFMEVLVPIIFLVLWGIGKAFGSKEDDEKVPPAPDKRERTRNIFHEIERKMAERQAQSGPAAATPTLHREPPVARQPAMAPRQQPAQQFPRSIRGAEPPPIMRSPAFSPAPPISTRDYEKELAVEMQRLREAKEEQEQLTRKAKIKAKKSTDDPWGIKDKQSAESWEIKVSSSKFKEDLISLLQDADGTRKAVLYYEILGPPVGLRRGQGVTHFS